MDTQLEAKLIECLDALAQGDSIEYILARYPQEAAQLRPLLETAAGLPTLRMEPSEAAKMQSRQKFMAQAEMLRRATRRKAMGFLPRFATGFIAVVLVAGALGTGAVAASGSALPGDPLYGLKRTVEDVRLQSAASSAQRLALQREFEQRRLQETDELLNAGREGEVEFTGTIEVIQPNAWIVSGLVVQLGANTQIAGTPQLNRVAQVRGATSPKGLLASSILVEAASGPEATATPEVNEKSPLTATPEPTQPAEATEAPAPTTTRITPQATSSAQPTVTPRPQATPEPADTLQPAEVDFTGNVDSIAQGTWSIDGTTISVTDNTEIAGNINVGQRVTVKALRLGNGQLIATHIELLDNGSVDNRPNGSSTPNPSPAPTESHNNDHGGSTSEPPPEPTETHSSDHGGSTPEPSPKPTEDHSGS